MILAQYSPPLTATYCGLVFSFVSLLIRLNDSNPTVELFYIVHNTSHPFFRFAKNDVAECIGFLNEHKKKRDVTSQAKSLESMRSL